MTFVADIEKENLEAHVELSLQRYASLDERLTRIEAKVNSLQTIIENSSNSMTKVLVGTAGTVVASVLGVLVVVLTKMH